MLNAAAAWLAVIVIQFGQPVAHIVEFPSIVECREAEDRIVDKLYKNDNVSLVEYHCFYRD